jgi:hypothetical protein
MPSSFENFKKQLDDAVSLIERSNIASSKSRFAGNINAPVQLQSLVDTNSLLARCEHVCEKHKEKKPTIRVIHHLACSGGSLISKCISAMPNVYLLSEVHPTRFSNNERVNTCFSPTNIPLLCFYAGIPDLDELNSEIFLSNIMHVHKHCEKLGAKLVLRDHSHSDYTEGRHTPARSEILNVLSSEFDVKSLVTIRDPAESFSSLKRNGWIRFHPDTFQEYCERVLFFLSQFDSSCIKTYESFVDSPKETMNDICNFLDIPYDKNFEYIFDSFRVTGDSGRKGSEIKRRLVDMIDEVASQIEINKKYQEIIQAYF